MFRKSIFIMLFVCLLAASNYALAAQDNWNPTGGQTDWFSGANWSLGAPPTAADWAAIQPGDANSQPRIDGDAVADLLDIAPWNYGGIGSLDVISGSATFGSELRVAAAGDFPNEWTSPTYLYVHGGTVTTNTSGSAGLTIGKPYSSYNVGKVIMYGGLISVPRITLNRGTIDLYGGTLECTGDANFIFNQALMANKINLNGGTLRVAGDHAAELTALYKNGRIIALRGGSVGAPSYNAGTNYTTITGTAADFNQAWNPIPEMNATNVHYYNGSDTNSVTLTWNRGDTNVIQHDIYFGTSTAVTLQATYTDANAGDPCSYTVSGFNFKTNTAYYWRIDETRIVSFNYDESGNPISNNTALTTGQVWKFTTHNGNAYNQKPQNGAAALSEPLALSWTAGDFAASANGHKIYFATGSSNNLNASLRKTWTTADPRFRGAQTGTSYSLANLAGAFTIVPGTTYYWCVDEVNGTTTWSGPVWSFTAAAYVNIDDFEDYNTFADINANWLGAPGSGPYNNSCGDGYGSNSGLTLIPSANGKYMRFTYINSDSSRGVVFSETRRPYAGGTSFTGGSVLSPALAALRVDYQGAASNGADPVYDRMYLALEDTAGNVAIYLNPDANAAQVTSWTSWFSSLKDVCDAGVPTDVKLSAVTGFCLGFGDRLTCRTSMPPDFFAGDGNVMFDNIRLYAQTCNPSYAHTHGASADFDNDCDVDINDLDVMASDWLQRAQVNTFDPITNPGTPVLWYKFDETGDAITAQDSGATGSYPGDIYNRITRTWIPGGRDGGGCLNLLSGANSYVSIPTASLNFMGDDAHSAANGGGGITFATWINADLTAFGGWIYGFIVVKDVNGADAVEIACPHHYNASGADWEKYPWAGWAKNEPNNGFSLGPGTAAADYGTRWNHWAFVKAPHTVSWYCNGILLRQEADTDANNGDPNIDGPLFPLPVSAFTIGLGGWGGNWAGYIDDFQVYDRALTPAEVAWLATDGTGSVILPLGKATNIKTDDHDIATQVVNFGDMAILGQQFHTLILWP